MNSTINNNYFLKKEERQILELALQINPLKSPRELITEAFKLLKEKALQEVRDKELRQLKAEEEMEKIHTKLRKNQEFMKIDSKDLDDYIYG
jgi:hypothetical protein